jgi:hypothetical protein
MTRQMHEPTNSPALATRSNTWNAAMNTATTTGWLRIGGERIALDKLVVGRGTEQRAKRDDAGDDNEHVSHKAGSLAQVGR